MNGIDGQALTSPARHFALALLALFALGGCGDGGTSDADAAPPAEDTTGDATPAGPFDAAIVASALTGNAPLTLDFSVAVTPPAGLDGEAAASWEGGLRYRWTVDDAPAGEEAEFGFSFFRAGSATIALTVTDVATGLTATDAVIVRVRGCADLRFEAFAVDVPTTLPPGGQLRVLRGALVNDGDAVEGPVSVAVGLAATEFWDPATGFLSAPLVLDGLAAGPAGRVELAGQAFDLPADIPEGTYAAFLVADPEAVVNECQEANNALAGAGVIEIDIDAGRLPDLVLADVDIPAGLVVSQGDNLSYGFRIENGGDADSRQFRYGFWISDDPVLSPESDRAIALPTDQTSRVQNLPAAGALGFLKTWRVPEDLPDGSYWLIGAVDATDLVFERDETNNVAVSAHPFEMRFEEPSCYDLDVGAGVTVNTTTTYWGGSVLATVTVANPGTLPTPAGWTLRAYLSQSRSFNPATGRLAASVTGAVIPPGGSETFEILVPITSDYPVFPHYLGVWVDPLGLFEECQESNNSAAVPEAIAIEAVARVDLAVSDFVYHPTDVAAGGILRAQYTITNRGTAPATAFRATVALSAVNVFALEGFQDGRAVTLDRVTLPSLAAGASVEFTREIIVPTALDHAVASWQIAAIADLEGLIGADNVRSNNLLRGASPLVVTGALGGCFEDLHEPNDALPDAAVVEPGVLTDIGSCGNKDFFAIPVEAQSSLEVVVDAAQILSTPPLPASLVVTLRDPDGAVVGRSDLGARHRVTAFVAPSSGLYTVEVSPAVPSARASYSLALSVRAPADGVDIALGGLSLDPAVGYPGGRLALSGVEANLGRDAAGAYAHRVVLSGNGDPLEAGALQLGVFPAAPIEGLEVRPFRIDADLPLSLAGGQWYVHLLAVTEDLPGELDDTNQAAVAFPFTVDPARTCLTDRFEPNDAPAFATAVDAAAGAERLTGAIVCPGGEDWYGVPLTPGRALELILRQDYDPARGPARLELVGPDGVAVHLSADIELEGRLELPDAYLAGTWFARVTHGRPDDGLPLTYDLTVSTRTAADAARCDADGREPDNHVGAAKPIGCAMVSGTICRTDLDFYRVAATAGTPLSVTLNHATGGLKAALLSADGQRVLAQRQANGTFSHSPAESGPILLRVDSRFGASGLTSYPYTVSVSGIVAPDLAVSELGADAAIAWAGEELGVRFDVVNACTEAADPFRTVLFLSSDREAWPGDLQLVEVASASGLAPGAVEGFDAKVQVPVSTPSGHYWLIAFADVDDRVAEPDPANNVVAIPLEVRAPCGPDRFEPNDGAAAAAPLVAGAEEGLVVCPGDVDWFAVSIPDGGAVVDVAIAFAHAAGDLDLRVYDGAAGTSVPVATSATREDGEAVSVDMPVAGTLFVRVAGYLGASAPYDISVTLTER